MTITLRPYQARVRTELWDWFRDNPSGEPVVEACVGAGKSVMIAEACRDAVQSWPGTRIVVVVHQRELLSQNVDKMLRIWPGAPVGIWSAAMGKRRIDTITFATIGSIYEHAALLGRVSLIFCDEAHLVNPKEAGMWRKLISDVRTLGNPHMRVVGWTGTPFRGNGVWLTAGDDALFTAIVSRVKIKELLDLGFLAPLVPAVAPRLIDTSDVRRSGDDYNIGDLERAADKSDIVQEACAKIVDLGSDRARWLVFAVTVKHAEHVQEELTRLGVPASIVTGNTPKAQRDELIADYRRGLIKCMVGVGVFTTGFDVPELDFIALLRPTKSPVLYVQMLGRGMRVLGADIDESRENGKADCLVADFTDTVASLGPIDTVVGKMPRRGGKKEAPFKLCPQCGSRNAPRATECKECGSPFELVDSEPHGTDPSGAALLSDQIVPKDPVDRFVKVTHVSYRLHQREGKVPSVCVDYFSGPKRLAAEWVCFQHTGPARMKAVKWWKHRHAPQDGQFAHPVPTSAADGLQLIHKLSRERALRVPASIDILRVGKYPDIVGVHFADDVSDRHDGQAAPQGQDPRNQGEPAASQFGAVAPGGGGDQLRPVRSLSRWVVQPVRNETT